MSEDEVNALNALKAQIKEQQKDDPHVAAKVAASALLEKIFSVMKDEQGVHVESAFAALGALAGYTCQQSGIEQKTNHGSEESLMVVEGNDGHKYLYGDAINKPLAEDRFSIWSLLGGAIELHGGELPDINEIFTHVSRTVGGAQFGIPRLPENCGIRYQPKDCLALWLPLKVQILDELGVPANDWPLAYGLAIQSLLKEAKDILSPEKAAIIVMECAVPMSKVIIRNDESDE